MLDWRREGPLWAILLEMVDLWVHGGEGLLLDGGWRCHWMGWMLVSVWDKGGGIV